MKESNRQKILIFAIIALVITNITSLSFMWSMKKAEEKPHYHNGGENRGGMGRFVVRELGFDSAQQKAYYELRDKFVKQQFILMDSVKTLRRNFFNELKNDHIDSAEISELAANIGLVQARLDKRTFNHFRQVKKICTPEQAAKYDTITQEIINRMVDPRRMSNNNKSGRLGDSSKSEKRNYPKENHIPKP